MIAAACLFASVDIAGACDPRIAGSCKPPAPPTEATAPNAGPAMRTGRNEGRRSERTSRSSYRRDRYSRKRSRYATRAAKYRESTRRRFSREAVAAADPEATQEAPDAIGQAPAAETEDRSAAAAPNTIDAGDGFVVHVRKSITLPMPLAQNASPPVIENVTTAPPPPIPAPVQPQAAPPPAQAAAPRPVVTASVIPARPAAAATMDVSENTGAAFASSPAEPKSEVTLLRLIFVSLAGLLAVGTAVRLAIG